MIERFAREAHSQLSPGQSWAALSVADHARREAFKAIKPPPKRTPHPFWRRLLSL